MKKIFLLSLACLLAIIAQAQFANGTGTKEDPYIISSAEQLDRVRDDLTASYKLANDIDLTAFLAESAEGWEPIGIRSEGNQFTGNFNGAGHKITGLWINRTTNDIGLFGNISGATIEKTGIKTAAAGIIGAYNVGGLVGTNLGSTITNCYTTGKITGNEAIGGLIGYNTTERNIAGSTITNCYSTADVTGNWTVGGLVGTNWDATIRNCYAAGKVTGNIEVGGLVGRRMTSNLGILSSITNSFFDSNTTEQTVGTNGNLTDVRITAKTTAEMQRKSTFSSWGFETIWGICENMTYPFLQWQGVDCNNLSSVVEIDNNPPVPVAYYNLQGVHLPEVPENGVYIILYDNGKAEKVIK